MNRNKMVLAALAVSGENLFSPVQIQNFFFYIDRKLGAALGGPYFHFTFKDFGPCDAELYRILADLRDQGDVEIFCMPGSAVIKAYGITGAGRRKAETEPAKISAWAAKEIKDLCDVVQTSSASSEGMERQELLKTRGSQRA